MTGLQKQDNKGPALKSKLVIGMLILYLEKQKELLHNKKL